MKTLLVSSALFLSIGVAFATDDPFMKGGLWTMHTVSTTDPGGKRDEHTRSICQSHDYQVHVRELSKKTLSTCKTLSENRSGRTKTSETECTIAGTVIHTKAVVTMNSETSAHSETHATYTPPMAGMSGTTMVQDSTYMGACPAGVMPGDMIGADGKKTSLWKH